MYNPRLIYVTIVDSQAIITVLVGFVHLSKLIAWRKFSSIAYALWTTSGRIRLKSNKLTRWMRKFLPKFLSRISFPLSSTKLKQALGICISAMKLQNSKKITFRNKRMKGKCKWNANWKWKLHCKNPKRKFILSSQEKRQESRFKVSSERQSNNYKHLNYFLKET